MPIKRRKHLPKIIQTDARHKISLGPHAAQYYAIPETDDGFRLSEVVDIVTKRDAELKNDDAFWQKNLDVLNGETFEAR